MKPVKLWAYYSEGAHGAQQRHNSVCKGSMDEETQTSFGRWRLSGRLGWDCVVRSHRCVEGQAQARPSGKAGRGGTGMWEAPWLGIYFFVHDLEHLYSRLIEWLLQGLVLGEGCILIIFPWGGDRTTLLGTLSCSSTPMIASSTFHRHVVFLTFWNPPASEASEVTGIFEVVPETSYQWIKN